MQSLQSRSVKAFTANGPRGSTRVARAVRCQAQQQQRQGLRPEIAAGIAAAASLVAPAAQAAQEVMQMAEVDVSLALGGGAAVAGLGALLVATDPQKRRASQMEQTGGDELEAVKKYFNTSGFERWNKIYGETDEVNKVQLDIRNGHAQTVDKVLKWFDEEGSLEGVTVADCGCGTGSLAIPMAVRGAAVSASDISSSMAQEAARRYEAAKPAGGKGSATFDASDLESVTGRYDTVTCIDVMIHYPQDKADAMITHLAGLSDRRLVVSFAPKTPYYSVLKRIGELFPGPSKATRAYLHAEDDVEAALNRAGFKVTKREMTATNFYFSRLLEAVRA
ncbi:MAG: magnesium protoporphyrin IX S-adenosyl methionine O-methyl transferase chloroplast precursor [Monoraphidium minutum]|nr:MAG: magnesium protoporphyrin IX S-adenosyl methionine O-methyl transferase chloroplast precursor [Monoraphidium minutum]